MPSRQFGWSAAAFGIRPDCLRCGAWIYFNQLAGPGEIGVIRLPPGCRPAGREGRPGFSAGRPGRGLGPVHPDGRGCPQLPGDGGLFGSGTSPLRLGTAALLGSLPQALGVPGLGGGALGPLFLAARRGARRCVPGPPPQDGNLPGAFTATRKVEPDSSKSGRQSRRQW